MLAAIRRLPRTVWLLGLISLVNDSASDMIYPLVPLYLTSVLMAGPKALGLIEGVAEAAASLLKLAAGVLADRSPAIRSRASRDRCSRLHRAGSACLSAASPIASAKACAARRAMRCSCTASPRTSGASRSACIAQWTTPAR